jgi:putative membrane protein
MAWHPHIDVWLLVLGLEGGYLWALRRIGPRHVPAGTPPATRGQVTAFSLGVLTILVAADWPIHELAERRLYSVHMVQHLLLSLAAPPLLLLGTPGWLARAILRPPALLRLVRRLSRPIVALILFNLVIALSHWPVLVEASVRSELFHLGAHVAVFGTALLMWMPVLSPVLEIPRLPYPGQMMYLFAQSILPTIPASFLTFGDTPMYAVYVTFPRIFGISALTDQMVAGLFMKIVGGLLLWTVIAILFFKWHEQETRDGTDALQWRDVDRDLNRVETPR